MLKRKRGNVACPDSRMCISAPQKQHDQDKENEKDPTRWLGKLILFSIKTMSRYIIFQSKQRRAETRLTLGEMFGILKDLMTGHLTNWWTRGGFSFQLKRTDGKRGRNWSQRSKKTGFFPSKKDQRR